MIRFILALFVPFRRLIEKLGADYDQFITILRLKLMLDDRRIRINSRNSGGQQATMLLKQSFTQVIMGAAFTMILVLIKTPFTYYYFAHILIMTFMAMVIVSEFTSILFDTSDNAIIQPLPIKGNTMSLARNAHIFLYLTLMALSLSLFSLGVAIFRFGVVSGLLFLFSLFLNVLFTLFLANILYLVIMRFANGEKLKNLVMYFQVIIAILFMSGYQIGIRMIDKSHFAEMVLPVHWYTYLIPPAFFSGFIEGFSTLNFDSQHIVLITEALTLPFLAFYFSGKYLTPLFNRKLMELEQGDRAAKVKVESSNESWWFKLLTALMIFNETERATFKFAWKMIGRERIFKQKLLPQFGYVVVMIIIPFINHPIGLQELAQSNQYVTFLYVPLFLAVGLTTSMSAGNSKNAIWIFKVLPVSSPADFFKAFIKAAYAKFFIPFYLFIGVAVCSFWGIKVLPDVLIVLFASYLVTICIYYLQDCHFPFTLENVAARSGSSVVKVLGVLIFTVLLALLHRYLFRAFDYATLILIPFCLGAILLVNRVVVYRKITWRKVDRANSFG